MSTRDEILEALTEHPDGLTSKELAPMCPACECDAMIVGRNIATLRAEGVIHPGTELREGATIWIFGKQVEAPHPEPLITLPLAREPRAVDASDAARAVSDMRKSARPVTSRAPAEPATTTSPAPAAVQPKHEEPAMTVREKIERILKQHGPLDSRGIRAKGLKHETLSQHLRELADRKVLVRLGGGLRSTIYGLPGQAVKGAQSPVPSAPHETQRPAKPYDSLYGAALLDLRERREGLVGEIAKLDRAIEAVEALAA